MLEHTFCHIQGIGEKTEKKLWDAGIEKWGDWQDQIPLGLSKKARLEIPAIFEQSRMALDNKDPHFFCNRLKACDQWRIFPHFREHTCYLDIETTGLGENAEITTISLYDGKDVFCYVNGRNLDNFIDHIHRFKVIVSYNGKSFDIPVIEHFFKTTLKHAQIDLRFVLAHLGFKGGLKGCEKQMGINRGTLDGVDGAFAVYLWRHFERYNDEQALETLLAYNIEDTVNLERLLVTAFNIHVEKMVFGDKLFLPYPELPPIHYQPNIEYVQQLTKQYYR